MFRLRNEILIGGLVTLFLIGAAALYARTYAAPKINREISAPTSSTVDSELAKHNTPSDCWIVIDKKTLNVTSFLNLHPGGAEAITPYCGKDATNAFNGIEGGRGHSANAVAMMEKYLVKLVGKSPPTPTPTTAIVQKSGELTWGEVTKHTTQADCWIVINNKVLRISPFLSLHPGGAEAIVPYCGKDATDAFNRVGHSNQAIAMFSNYLVGLIGK